MEGDGENPLLDSRFPDVSAKGRGYQLQSYPEGIEGWPSLRRVTIWQTVAALEMEFRERATKFAEAKKAAELRASQQQQDEDKKQDESIENDSVASGKSPTEEEKSEKGSKRSDKAEDESSVREPTEIADSKEDNDVQPTRTSKSSMKSLPANELKENNSKLSADNSEASSPSVSRYSAARPHHVPKLDSLSKKLEQIRAEMGEEVFFVDLISPSHSLTF
jgi:hypothetical protein